MPEADPQNPLLLCERLLEEVDQLQDPRLVRYTSEAVLNTRAKQQLATKNRVFWNARF